ncbi:MAG: hypothetical protein R2758_08160 [Bacteroidales bacterium]
MSLFFGALYLFTINTVFIALSALIISQVLKLPIRSDNRGITEEKDQPYDFICPGTGTHTQHLFRYLLVQKENFTERAGRYIDNISVVEGNYLLKHEIDPKTRSIQLVYGGQLPFR